MTVNVKDVCAETILKSLIPAADVKRARESMILIRSARFDSNPARSTPNHVRQGKTTKEGVIKGIGGTNIKLFRGPITNE